MIVASGFLKFPMHVLGKSTHGHLRHDCTPIGDSNFM